jgi:hypothetical protein
MVTVSLSSANSAPGGPPARTASVGPSMAGPCQPPVSACASLTDSGPVISPVPWFSTMSRAPQRPQNLWASL